MMNKISNKMKNVMKYVSKCNEIAKHFSGCLQPLSFLLKLCYLNKIYVIVKVVNET